jgi:nitric oxide reductase subunit B
VILYVYGQFKEEGDPFTGNGTSLTTNDLEQGRIRATQKATYKFFVFSIVLFGAQVISGMLAATDLVTPLGVSLADIIRFSVLRSYHAVPDLLVLHGAGRYTIFFLPRISRVPNGQLFLVNLLFGICVVTGVGALVGIYAGQTGMITGQTAYWFGSQGWEFMELGRAFQYTLLGSFALWIFIIYRAVRPWLTTKNVWSVPSWLL